MILYILGLEKGVVSIKSFYILVGIDKIFKQEMKLYLYYLRKKKVILKVIIIIIGYIEGVMMFKKKVGCI